MRFIVASGLGTTQVRAAHAMAHLATQYTSVHEKAQPSMNSVKHVAYFPVYDVGDLPPHTKQANKPVPLLLCLRGMSQLRRMLKLDPIPALPRCNGFDGGLGSLANILQDHNSGCCRKRVTQPRVVDSVPWEPAAANAGQHSPSTCLLFQGSGSPAGFNSASACELV